MADPSSPTSQALLNLVSSSSLLAPPARSCPNNRGDAIEERIGVSQSESNAVQYRANVVQTRGTETSDLVEVVAQSCTGDAVKVPTGGIVADEISMDLSSSSILPSVIVHGKAISSRMTTSLPSSPRKTELHCSLDQLRAKIHHMRNVNCPQLDVLRDAGIGDVSLKSLEQQVEQPATGSYLPYVLVKGSIDDPRCSSSSSTLKMTHSSPRVPPAYNQASQYPDKANTREALPQKSALLSATRQPTPQVSNFEPFPPKPLKDQISHLLPLPG